MLLKPHVTELLDLLNKPALINWANKIGLQGQKLSEYRKKSLVAGTNIHTQIYEYVTKGKQFDSLEVESKFKQFISDKQIIDMEQTVENKWFIDRGYLRIPDEAPIELENKCWCPSWRRMCKVILRNDYWCKGLGQTQPKSEAYGRYKAMKKEKMALRNKI